MTVATAPYKRYFGESDREVEVDTELSKHRYELDEELLYRNPSAKPSVEHRLSARDLDTEVAPYSNPSRRGRVSFRRRKLSEAGLVSDVRTGSRRGFGPWFDSIFIQRQSEADSFYASIFAPHCTEEERLIARQAYAGMLCSKQFYFVAIKDWYVLAHIPVAVLRTRIVQCGCSRLRAPEVFRCLSLHVLSVGILLLHGSPKG